MDYYDINNIDFKPYDRYGKDSIVAGLSWKNLHYDEKTYCGTYLLRFDKDTQSKYHEHMDYEEFLILRGTLYDSHSNRVHSAGTYVKMYPGTRHYSYSSEGCLVFVISHGNFIFPKL